jgi:hypothetical protein
MPRATSGIATEAAVLAALVARNFDVLVPFGDGHPFDLAVQVAPGRFLRIQCKTAWSTTGCLTFNNRRTDHGRGRRSYLGLADVFGVHHRTSDAVYLVPLNAVAASQGRLRLEPTLNNQRRGIRMAADFEIDRWTTERLLALVP